MLKPENVPLAYSKHSQIVPNCPTAIKESQLKVLNCFLDNRFGGPHRRAQSVAEKLRQDGIKTIFLFNERLKENIPFKQFEVVLIKHMQCITRQNTLLNLFLFCLCFPYNLYKITKLIDTEKIDLVHTSGLMNILPVLAARLNNVKVIWHLNDTLTPWIIRKLFLPFVLLFSDKIAISAKSVGKHYYGNNKKFWSKSVILYPPVDTNKFNRKLLDAHKVETFKKKFNITRGDLIIGTIGNINSAKGYMYYVEAANLIKRKKKNVKFIIVGSKLDTKITYYEKICNRIRSLGLEENVTLTGFSEDVAEILSVCDLFVLSSVSAACPIALLEAMAMEVPVVATNVSGVAEQIINGETGVLVEARRADLLAEAVLNLTNLPKETLKQMVAKGRERAEKIFSLPIIAEKHNNIYKSLVTSSPKENESLNNNCLS